MTDFNTADEAIEAETATVEATPAEPFMVSTATIDVITRAAFKYRVITRSSADMLGAELIRLNALATGEGGTIVAYVRTPFERKVKRAVIDGAIRCWMAQVSGVENIRETATWKLIERVKAKNEDRMGIVSYTPDVYDENGEFISRGERQVEVPNHDFWDVTDRDDEALLIRSREARDAEAAAVLAARLAERRAANESSADEDYDDEDEWDDDDE